MSGQATVRALTGLLHDLTDEEILELTLSDNRPGLKEFLQARVSERMPTVGADQSCAEAPHQVLVAPAPLASTYFLPLPDSQVPLTYYPTLLKYRAEAAQQGVPVSTPLCYRVAKGYMLKTHAPKAGPCRENFQYLQNWNFEDNPTDDCLVFWIPRLVPGSTGKTVDEQMSHMVEFRHRLDLPVHHCSSFGSVALLSGLILVHYRATGEQVPLIGLLTRTDSRYADGSRLHLGWDSGALRCGSWYWDVGRDISIGCFALGVEALGS